MQKTFRDFIELAEGKKKELKRLKSAYYLGREQSPTFTDHPNIGAPNSPERRAHIKKMNKQTGRGAIIRAANEFDERATKAAKTILKQRKKEQQQEGFSVKQTQKELEKRRKEAEQKKRQEAEQRREELHRERTRGRGIRAVHKGQSGWMKDGKFTIDT
jgi:hypothetical protein